MPQVPGPAHIEAVLCQQVGRRVGRLEAVADIGHVVDPEGARLVGGDAAVRVGDLRIAVVVALAQLLVVALVGHRLHQALVGVLAEHGRDHRSDADAGEEPRVVPRHHLGQPPHAQLPKRIELHDMPPLDILDPCATCRRPARLAPAIRRKKGRRSAIASAGSGSRLPCCRKSTSPQRRSPTREPRWPRHMVTGVGSARPQHIAGGLGGPRRRQARWRAYERAVRPSCSGPTCGAARCRCETRRCRSG